MLTHHSKNLTWILIVISLIGIFCPVVANAADKDIYYCPMHPHIVSDKPGECPICHMELVLKESRATSSSVPGYTTVTVNPEKQQLIGIRTSVVQKKKLNRSLETAARVAYDPELYEAQIEYLKEYRIAIGTRRNNELEFKNLTNSRWEAPRIEIAKSKLILLGMDEESIQEIVDAGKADVSLLYLKPDSDIWAYAYVFESEVPWIHKGDRVRLESASLPGKVYEGVIHNISPMVEEESRRVHLHIRLKNDGSLKPQMFLNATIETSLGEGLAVPAEAVFFTGQSAIVFIDKGDGIFEPRVVKAGARVDLDYEILEGLKVGEKIVVNGNFLLDSESRLKASIEEAVKHVG